MRCLQELPAFCMSYWQTAAQLAHYITASNLNAARRYTIVGFKVAPTLLSTPVHQHCFTPVSSHTKQVPLFFWWLPALWIAVHRGHVPGASLAHTRIIECKSLWTYSVSHNTSTRQFSGVSTWEGVFCARGKRCLRARQTKQVGVWVICLRARDRPFQSKQPFFWEGGNS